MKTCFKIDTAAYGNLLPLAEFFKHFPDANMNELARSFDSFMHTVGANKGL